MTHIVNRIARHTVLLSIGLLLVLQACSPVALQPLPATALPTVAMPADTPTPAQALTETVSPVPAQQVTVYQISTDIPRITINAQSVKTNSVPEDVLKELMYSGKGGNMGRSCEQYGDVVLAGEKRISVLGFHWGSDFVSCGLKEGQSVTFTLVYPDGSAKTTTEIANGDNPTWAQVSFDAPRGPGTQLGTYELRMVGPDRSASVKFEMVKPDYPGTYGIDGQKLLYGLQPNEHVRALLYQGDNYFYSLSGWYDFTVDAQGQALVSVGPDLSKNDLFFLGDQSGEISNGLSVIESLNKSHYKQAMARFTCPGALISRLYLYAQARTTYTDGTSTALREYPGKDAKKVANLAEGKEFFIIGGPICKDSTVWWNIHTKDGKDGWIAEGDQKVYYIEPLP